MDILSDCVDSPLCNPSHFFECNINFPLAENPSPSTEPSVEESAPRSLEGLRSK